MTASIDIYGWQSVPSRVVETLEQVKKLRAAHEKAAGIARILPFTFATWEPETGGVYVYAPSGTEIPEKAAYAYADAFEVPAVSIIFSQPQHLNTANEVLIKCGSVAAPVVKQTWALGNRAMLGPSPLSNGIVSALMLGGLGYGAGRIAETVYPGRYNEKHNDLKKRLGLAGLLAGGGIGLANAYATSRALKQPYLKSLVTSNNTPVVYPFEKESYNFGYGFDPTNPMVPDAIGPNQPIINVPQFNTAMWRDVQHGMINPYGPYGMHTPPPIAAAATGLTSAVASNMGTAIISPNDLAHGFVAAGASPQAASIAGRTLGALAGLAPPVQQQLQSSGIWGGIVTTVVPPMFSGRR